MVGADKIDLTDQPSPFVSQTEIEGNFFVEEARPKRLCCEKRGGGSKTSAQRCARFERC